MKAGRYEFAGVKLHAIADFYSHSNYIPLYQEYATKNGLSMDINDIPTFSEAMNNPDLMKFLGDNDFRTGSFPASGKNSHAKMNLDENKGKGAESYNGKNTMHEAAKATAQKDLNKTVQGID